MKKFRGSDIVRAMLLAGGIEEKCAEKLISHLDSDEVDDLGLLLRDNQLMIIESLTYSWIIEKLKYIAEGRDKQAAVTALGLLVELNKELLNIKPVMNEFC